MDIETIIQHTLGPLGALAISVFVAFKLFQFVERLIQEFKEYNERHVAEFKCYNERLVTAFEKELAICNTRYEMVFQELMKELKNG
jgi:hypothetical protein